MQAAQVLGELDSLLSLPIDSNELEGSPQLSLFAPHSETKKEVQTEPLVPHPIFQEIESVDINQMTPLQALGFVVKLKELCSASECIKADGRFLA